MNKFAIVLTLGAAALFGGSAASATENAPKTNAATHVNDATDFSSHRRHWRHRHVHRYWHHRPYYRSYGYAPAPYYYGGGPAISFSFGGGGWGHHHRRHHHW
jgi:hypothetical protein